LRNVLIIVGLALSLSACRGQEETNRPKKYSHMQAESNCMPKSERMKIESSNVSDIDARRLANHYGICASDVGEQEKWLKVLAARGDVSAMEDLAAILRFLPGREKESKVWLEKARAQKEGT